VYGDNPVFPRLYIRENNKVNPVLPNIKGAVFEVQIPLKYKAASRLRKLRARFEKEKVVVSSPFVLAPFFPLQGTLTFPRTHADQRQERGGNSPS